MSVDQVKAFMAKVKEEPELAKKFIEAKEAYKGSEENAIAEIIIPIAAEAGFKFTVEDFKAASSNEGEASEDELDAVAGGATCIPNTTLGINEICFYNRGVRV